MQEAMAVSDEMMAAGLEVFRRYESEDDVGLVSEVYLAMRALEPAVTVAPTFYDIAIDAPRPVTSLDIAGMQATVNAYAAIVSAIDRIRAQRAEEVRQMRSKAGAPHEGDVT